jgi:hypothetical protein
MEPLKLIFNDITNIGGIFCGGYVRYMVSPVPKPAPANDIDIYSQTDEIYSQLKQYLKDLGLQINRESEFSISFKILYDRNGKIKAPSSSLDDVFTSIDDVSWEHDKTIIQLIKPINRGKMVCKGDQKEVLNNFDFTVVRAGLVSLDKAIVDVHFKRDEESKRLVFKNIHSPVSSIFRIVKYGQRGYKIKPTELVKMFFDWDKRPQEYKDKVFQALTRLENFGITSSNDSSSLGEDGDRRPLSISEIEEMEMLLFVGGESDE